MPAFFVIAGKRRAGFYPLTSKGTVRAACIEVESHGDRGLPAGTDLEIVCNSLLRAGEARGLRLVRERSKGGNFHVWVCFSSPVSACAARRLLRELWTAVGYRTTAADGLPEVFPKQDRLDSGMTGNGVGLPYYGPDVREERTVFLDPHGFPLPLDRLGEVPRNSPEILGDEPEVPPALPAEPVEDGALGPGKRHSAFLDVLTAVWKDGNATNNDLRCGSSPWRA